jgi:hypothetical protein
MREYHPSPSRLTPVFTFVLTGLLLCLSASQVLAATYNWLGVTDDNWSTGANWDVGTPPAFDGDVRFYDGDATGTPGLSGTPNSIVDTNQAS